MTDLMVMTLLMLVPFFLSFVTMMLGTDRSADTRVLPDHFIPGWEERRQTPQV
jgi:hypothetical protein